MGIQLLEFGFNNCIFQVYKNSVWQHKSQIFICCLSLGLLKIYILNLSEYPKDALIQFFFLIFYCMSVGLRIVLEEIRNLCGRIYVLLCLCTLMCTAELMCSTLYNLLCRYTWYASISCYLICVHPLGKWPRVYFETKVCQFQFMPGILKCRLWEFHMCIQCVLIISTPSHLHPITRSPPNFMVSFKIF